MSLSLRIDRQKGRFQYQYPAYHQSDRGNVHPPVLYLYPVACGRWIRLLSDCLYAADILLQLLSVSFSTRFELFHMRPCCICQRFTTDYQYSPADRYVGNADFVGYFYAFG